MIISKHNLNKKVLIIAEIGNNHEGNFLLAKKMINAAAIAGADAVKFQTFIAKNYVSEIANPERFKILNRFQLTIEQFKILKLYSNQLGLIFISTPLDIDSAKSLKPLVAAYKIASGDMNFLPMIKIIAKTNKPIILSTGVSGLFDIKQTLNFIKKYRSLDKIILLHCVSSYPTLPTQANLSNINSLKKLTKIVGYSDHTIGIDASICAVTMGARVIEKHFTIDNNYSDFRDHKLSSNPIDFAKLVEKIRKFEILIENKSFNSLPKKISTLIKRSIAINQNLPKGTILKKEHLTWIRPGNGLLPGVELKLIGKKLKVNLSSGTQLKMIHFLRK